MSDFRSVTAFMMWDHDRLDAILYEVFALVSEGLLERAGERFAGFLVGMEWHIRVEETVLFPEFEARAGVKKAPTDIARRDHANIQKALGDMKAALAVKDPRAFFVARRSFLSVLPTHHAQEEQLLYPIIDDSMSEDERVALVERLRATP